ncbi:DUF4349 domain-containing protein [Blastococcus sp. TML/M2B]|uniref:DUF4349 domain-containing protein n=1 Tax=unclassified Blastococcus TaxID=2619396 RepID=UPI0019096278|nr:MULTISPECIES: DUF4349 domain-containing protein [unclassified Blastococcus]MBN1092577.1 DUF4349 domain-containing protein [Blastococcus sp. TML/M2B]MBN1097329.1 DUF4349 domain-containing protein [Blastococcus sp. TML/C7B]
MRRLLGSAAVTLALVLVGGCSGSSGNGSSSSADGGGAGAVADEAADPVGGDAERQVITNADASLVVDDPAGAAQELSERVESAGGRVDERTEYAATGDDEGSSADLVVRVPSDALTDVLADLEDLGEVASVSVSRSDVTGDVVDLDARISALQTSVARLQALLDEAPSTEALLAAEGALSGRQEQLESLQSQRAFLADQVELSTLRLHLQQPGVAPPGGPDGFVDGLGTGWNALVSAGGAAVIALGVLLPWLVLAAVIAAAVLVPLRRRRAAAAAPAAGDAG